MQQLLLLLPIAIPVIFWAGYHYYKDRLLPEPLFNLALSFGLGVAAAVCSKYVYVGLEPLGLRYDAVALADESPLGLLAYSLLAIGPIEELSKLLPFLLVVLRFRALDEPLDGIIYASFLALGYAAAENYYYLEYLSPLITLARGFAGPVIHILFASIWAHWITRAKLNRTSISLAVLAGFSLAALLHGIYDFLVLLNPVAALPMAATMIVSIWVWRLLLIRQLNRRAANEASRH